MDDAQPSARERKKLETKQRILSVAVGLFQEQGFDNTSFDEVAQDANVSRATVFNYFPSKRDLLRGIAAEELEKLQEVAGGELGNVQEAVTKIRLVMRQLVADTLPYLNVTRYVIISSMLNPSPQAPTALGLGDILHRLVVEAQERGEIQCALNPVDVVHAISGAYLAVFFEQASHSRMDTWSEDLDVARIVDLLFEGIAGPRYSKPEWAGQA
jgi:AcrR family transcriptional regulator